MPAKKSSVSEIKEKLNKSGDTLDIQPTIEKAKEDAVANFATAKKIVAEIQELQDTPDMPKRWGQGRHKSLTIASPGAIIEDATYIPEYVETYSGERRHVSSHRVINGQTHTLSADSTRKFRWCNYTNARKMALHRRRGFNFVKYTDLFEHTGLFEHGEGNRVLNGDLCLMEVSMDGWERMAAEKERLQRHLEGEEGGSLFRAGEQYGAPTFREDKKRGVREYMT